jgi:hypothetical protein
MTVNLDMYRRGKQPCKKFEPKEEEWFGHSEHECIYCSSMERGGRVKFCHNCHRDHHYNGYETCERIGLECLYAS